MGKKELTMDDYGLWRTVASTKLSGDGQWVSYDYLQPDADEDAPDERKLQVEHLSSGRKHEIPLAVSPEFSDDSKWIACKIELERREAKKLQDKKEPVPEKVCLLNLETSATTTWDNTTAFAFSGNSAALAVWKAGTKDAKHGGKDLIVYDLRFNQARLIGSVSNYAFNKPGTLLAYTIDAADKAGNGLYVMNLASGLCTPLDQGLAIYSRPAWDEKGTALAALKGSEKEGFLHRENRLIAFTKVGGVARVRHELDPAADPDFPGNTVISEKGEVSWNSKATKVFFGIKEQETAPAGKDKPGEDVKPKPAVSEVDIWHWKDVRIQSVQRARAQKEKEFTYRAVFNIAAARFVRLTDERMRKITLTRHGKWGVGSDERAYIHDWKPLKADYYRVNTDTGERRPMMKALQRSLGLSPDSKYFAYWEDGHVGVYDLDAGTVRNLTQTAPVSFVNQEYDHFGEKPSYGLAGWSRDGKHLVLNHRYDLWLLPLAGGKAVNLTGGVGAAHEICLRYIKFDPDEETIDLSRPLILSAYGQWTKKAGFYRLGAGARGTRKAKALIFVDKSFGTPVKAKHADRYMFSMESFVQCPDYYVSDGTFSNPQRITNANPQQADYVWGHTVLIEYTNRDGVRLQASLAIPDSRKGNERLPMLVNFYEKLSQDLHRYVPPRYAYSAGSYLMEMVSRGCLLLAPDVHFRVGATGDDMLECIEAAVDKAVELGYADPARVGLCGHSFSGYGASYLATRSRKLAAACAGAGVMELGSDFNHLWGYSVDKKAGSGASAHDYEIYGQGRMGTNPHNDHALYRSQSPLTHVKGMTPPLLLMQGEADPIVAWIEAVSMYNAMRFNGKRIIMLSYPDEQHSVEKRVNRIDLTRRMMQFFGHYLMGAPAPDWMTKGVSFLEKEKAVQRSKPSQTGKA